MEIREKSIIIRPELAAPEVDEYDEVLATDRIFGCASIRYLRSTTREAGHLTLYRSNFRVHARRDRWIGRLPFAELSRVGEAHASVYRVELEVERAEHLSGRHGDDDLRERRRARDGDVEHPGVRRCDGVEVDALHVEGHLSDALPDLPACLVLDVNARDTRAAGLGGGEQVDERSGELAALAVPCRRVDDDGVLRGGKKRRVRTRVARAAHDGVAGDRGREGDGRERRGFVHVGGEFHEQVGAAACVHLARGR